MKNTYPWMRKVFLEGFLNDGSWLALLILSDWCEENGEEERAMFWRWVVSTKKIPLRNRANWIGPDISYDWWKHDHGADNEVGIELYEELKGGKRDMYVEYNSPFTAYVALEWAWMRSH